MKIGILDIQGSVEEHFSKLAEMKLDVVLAKKKEDLKDLSGLIIPGGESTTISKLLERYNLKDDIIKRYKRGMVIWGTCAGAILLAKEIKDGRRINSLKLMDIEVERNAYGRQLDSFETEVIFDEKKIPAVFIRAPRILKTGEKVKILSKCKNDIVAACEGNLLITTFHPELSEDFNVYKFFLDLCTKV